MKVKNIFFLLLVWFLTVEVRAQQIPLLDVIVKAYGKPSDISIIKGTKLSYIVPLSVCFIDTVNTENKQYSVVLLYHKNVQAFENHLKKVHDVTVLNVFYDKLYGDALEVTIEISKTKDQQYFGPYKFYTFIDKRKIRLLYNKKKSVWEYGSLIKLYDEPQAGRN